MGNEHSVSTLFQRRVQRPRLGQRGRIGRSVDRAGPLWLEASAVTDPKTWLVPTGADAGADVRNMVGRLWEKDNQNSRGL